MGLSLLRAFAVFCDPAAPNLLLHRSMKLPKRECVLCSYLSPTPASIALLAADMNVERDEIRRLAGKLKSAGIDVRVDRYCLSVTGDAYKAAFRAGATVC